MPQGRSSSVGAAAAVFELGCAAVLAGPHRFLEVLRGEAHGPAKQTTRDGHVLEGNFVRGVPENGK